MFKRLSAVILSITLIICAIPLSTITASAATSGTTGDCTWTLDGTVLTISGNGDMADYGYFDSPWGTSITKVIIENGVTHIGDFAFVDCPNLVTVILPSSVISIGEGAFEYFAYAGVYPRRKVYIDDIDDWWKIDFASSGSSPLYKRGGKIYVNGNPITELEVPNGVTCIDDYRLYGFEDLASITIPDSVTSIGGYAFYGCTSLTSITIPDGVTSIGNSAFSNCTNLTRITIPDGVTSIEDSTFSGCSSLTGITIPDSVTSIVGYVFYDCTSLTSITIPDSVTSIGNGAFYGCTSLTSITIPDGVTSIGDSAFSDCISLTSIEIPDGVTSIGGNAFYYCSSLTSITIPKSVTKIGGGDASMGTFYGCNSLSRVYITDLAAWCGIEFDHYYSNPLYWAGKLYINGELAKNIEIPDSVTSIKDYAFVEGGYLESVTIPESVKSVGTYAFYECSKLKSITIPKTVTSIGSYAFYGCNSLIKADIRSEVAIIEEYTFGNCMDLKSVFLPDDIILIKKYAFNNCYDLDDIYYEGDETTWDGVTVLQYNDPLNNAAIHYNATEIPKAVASIEIYSKPDKLKYYENTDNLDVTGGKIKITYEDTITEIIDIANSMVTGFDNMVVGSQSLTVTYGGKTAAFDIEIIDNIYSHDFKDGICEICGAKQFTIENATTSEPPFYYNGEYIYATYSATYENASEITIDLANSGCGGSDVMYIYDYAYNLIGTYTADEMALNNITVNGDTVRLKLVSTSGDMTYNAEITVKYDFAAGDTNGDITINAEDLTLLRKSLIGTAELKIYQSANADFNADGKCDLKDFVALKKILAGIN